MSFKDFVLDFFFPPRCAFCGAILEKSGDGVCETCRKALPRTADTERKCDFVRAYTAPFYYEPPVRQGILAYKFRSAPSRGQVFGRILGEDLLRRGADEFDLISWVPLSAKRCHRRGYDQVQLLAEAAAEASRPRCSSARPSRSASAIIFWTWARASALACSISSSTSRILVMASSDIVSPLFHLDYEGARIFTILHF